MSLRIRIEQAAEQNIPLEELQVDDKYLAAAQSHYRQHKLKLAASDSALDDRTMQGAEARNTLENLSEEELDTQFIQNQIPKGMGVRKAPEMGFSVGNAIAKFEDPKDKAKFLQKLIPDGAKPLKINTRSGEEIWGYADAAGTTFNRLTPHSLFESPTSTLGSALAHPVETAAAIAAAYLPIGRVAKIAAEGTAAAGGRVIDELEERRAGASDTVGDIGIEALQSGGLASATSGAFSGVEYLGGLLKKAEGGSPLGELSKSFERMAERVGDSPSTAYRPSIADKPGASPIVKRAVDLYDQLSGTAQRSKERSLEQIQLALDKQLREAAQKGALPVDEDGLIDWAAMAPELTDARGITLLGKMREDLINATKNSFEKMGRSVGSDDHLLRTINYENAITNYDRASKVAVNNAYDRAFDLADATYESGKPLKFSFQGLKGAINSIDSGAKLLVDGVPTQIDTKELATGLSPIIEQLKSLDVNQSDVLVKRNIPAPGGAGILGLKGTTDTKAEVLKPSSVMSEIKKLRTSLGDLSAPDPQTGQHTPTSRAAARLYGALTESLENPTGGTPDVRTAWKNANAMHKDRMSVLSYLNAGKTLEAARLDGAAKSLDDIYDQVSRSGSAPKVMLGVLKKELSPAEYADIQDGYISKLIEEPSSLYKRNWTPAERQLLDSKTRDLLKQHGLRNSRIDKSQLAKAIQQTNESGQRSKQLIMKSKPGEIKETLDAAGIPLDAYQATIFADLVARSTREVKGQLTVNPQALSSAVRSMKRPDKSEMWQLLSKQQRELLEDSDRMTSLIATTNALATSLEAMSIAAKKTNIMRPDQMISAQIDQTKYAMIGMMARNKAIINLIERGQSAKTPYAKARALTLAATLVTGDLLRGIETEKTDRSRY